MLMSPEKVSDLSKGNESLILDSLNTRELFGFWKYLFFAVDTDFYITVAAEAMVKWYFEYSYDKYLTPAYRRMWLYYEDDPGGVPVSCDKYFGTIIRNQFLKKWERIYQALTAKYDPTATYQGSKDYTDITTYDITEDRDSSIKYGKKVSEQTDLTTEDTDEVNNGYYGFNSAAASPTAKNNSTSTRKVTGSANSNTTGASGTDTSDDTRKKTGTELFEHNEDVLYRDGSAARLLQEEIDLRIKNNMIKVILDDIDSVICLKVY